MNTLDRTHRSGLAKLWKYLRGQRSGVILASIFSVLNKLFDLAPPALIALAVDIVVAGESSVIARFGYPEPQAQLIVLAVLTAIIWICESVFEYFFRVAWKNLAQRTQDGLRKDAYAHMQEQRLGWFEDKSTGELVTVLNEDVNQLERFLDIGANDIIQVLTTILVIGSVYIIVAPSIGWVAVIPIPIIVAASVWFQKFLEPRYTSVRAAAGNTSSQLANNIQGMATIKSYGREEEENERIAFFSNEYRRANVQTIQLSSAFIPMIRMIILSGFIAIMLLAGFRAIEGSLAVGLYSLLIFVIQRLLWPLTRLGETFDLYQRSMASVHRIMRLFEFNEQIPSGERALETAVGNFEAQNLCFRYSTGPAVLSNVNFTIKAGWTVGIVGATGEGKTSLIKLFLRLYDVSAGRLLLDGHDIREYRLPDLVRSIAYVNQDVFLFHGTVKENIAYGAQDKEKPSEEDIVEAAKLAEAHDFICELPQGYHTVVGERGQKLSGGQRQRISLARALLKKAAILILDEATSSVDNETEAAIQRSLAHITGSCTSIVIAHRLSTIRKADRIFLLANGSVREQGTHEELLAEGGQYASLWRVQNGEAPNREALVG